MLGSLEPVGADSPYDITALPTIELRFESETWWADLLANRGSGDYVPAHLRFEREDFPTAGVRFHGRSSFSVHEVSKKVPFRIAVDLSRAARTLRGRRTLILKNNFNDPSLLREVLALKILGEYLPSPRASFVKLYINGESWGLYTNVELPDREFVERWFRDPNGPLHIGDRPFYLATLRAGRCEDAFPPIGSKGLESCAAIRRLLEVKDEAELGERRELLPALLDVDRTLRHLAAETAIGHTDGFPAHNYTLYQDPSNGRFATIPWDYNLSFQFPELALLPPGRGVLAEPTWYRRYRGYVRTMIEDSLSWERLGPWVSGIHRLIEDDVRRDGKSLFSHDTFVRAATAAVAVHGSSYARPGLKEFVDRRQRWLERSGLAARCGAALSYLEPSPGPAPSLVCLSVHASQAPVKRALVHLETDGRYHEIELFDNGELCDREGGDGTFAVGIEMPTPQTESSYYFSAETSTGEISFLPPSGGFRPYGLHPSPSYQPRVRPSEKSANRGSNPAAVFKMTAPHRGG